MAPPQSLLPRVRRWSDVSNFLSTDALRPSDEHRANDRDENNQYECTERSEIEPMCGTSVNHPKTNNKNVKIFKERKIILSLSKTKIKYKYKPQ